MGFGRAQAHSDKFTEGVTAEHEAQAFQEVRGYGPQEVSEFLGPWNGISCILRACCPVLTKLLVRNPQAEDTVSKNVSVVHQVW